MQRFKDWFQRNNVKFKEKSYGLLFTYQGGEFVIADNSSDTDFLSVMMPSILKYEEEDEETRVTLLEVCNNINDTVKVVKATIDESTVWLTTDILLCDFSDIDAILPRLLDLLHDTRYRFSHELRVLREENEKADSE